MGNKGKGLALIASGSHAFVAAAWISLRSHGIYDDFFQSPMNANAAASPPVTIGELGNRTLGNLGVWKGGEGVRESGSQGIRESGSGSGSGGGGGREVER